MIHNRLESIFCRLLGNSKGTTLLNYPRFASKWNNRKSAKVVLILVKFSQCRYGVELGMKMKKVIYLVTLSVLLAALVMPVVAFAQDDRPKECCTINRPIKFDDSGEDCDKGKISAPNTEAAAECAGGSLQPTGNVCGWSKWGMYCLINSINAVTDWIFYLMMIFVVVMIVIGGATYMLAAGSPERAGRGKGIIIYGIVGLVIALLARLIPSVVKMIIGMG